MTNNPQTGVTVTAQTISLLVTGQPDIGNKFGPGHIRPDSVRLSYRGHHIDARVDGRWVREGGELTNSRLDQHYRVRDAEDIVGWPDWLCALATLLRPTAPAATPAVPVPPTTHATDRATLRARIAAALDFAFEAFDSERTDDAHLSGHLADAVLAVLPPPADRAAVLREAADQYAKLADQGEAYDREQGQLDEAARLQHGTVRDVVFGLRRMADEAQQQPDTETREETGTALARYIADRPMSEIQAAIRILGWPALRFEPVDTQPADEAPQAETEPLLFWDETAGVLHNNGRIDIPLDKALNIAQSAPAGRLVLQVPTAAKLRAALTRALTEAADASEEADRG